MTFPSLIASAVAETESLTTMITAAETPPTESTAIEPTTAITAINNYNDITLV